MKEKILTGIIFCFISIAAPLGGETWSSFLTQTGAGIHWDPWRQSGIIHKGAKYLTFNLEDRLALWEGKRIIPLALVDTDQGPMPSEQTWKVLLDLFKDDPASPDQVSTMAPHRRIGLILLDPGHGGKDPGTVYTHGQGTQKFTLREKDLTLKVALYLEGLLKNQYPEKRVLLTRRDDSYPTLEERVELANNQSLSPGEEILYLSIHFNASVNLQARGFELWHLPEDYSRQVLGPSAQAIPAGAGEVLNSLVEEGFRQSSRDLAADLEKSLGSELLGLAESRGIREQAWFVVRGARMPSVLAELGFITNKEEAGLFRSDDYLKKLALGLYNGLESFIKRFE